MRVVRALVLILVLALSSSPVFASSYVNVNGGVVDPILYTAALGGGVHPYSGGNLGPSVSAPGANLPDAYLYAVDLSIADLTSADLRGAYLDFADLDQADLRGADLSNADLSRANLYRTDLKNADLSGAILDGTSGYYADLSFANLSGAYLEVDMYQANLFSADLRDITVGSAYLQGVYLGDANLSGARFLSKILGNPLYNDLTDFTNAWSGDTGSLQFDPVAAGWILVPEPSTATLFTIGLLGLAQRRRLRR